MLQLQLQKHDPCFYLVYCEHSPLLLTLGRSLQSFTFDSMKVEHDSAIGGLSFWSERSHGQIIHGLINFPQRRLSEKDLISDSRDPERGEECLRAGSRVSMATGRDGEGGSTGKFFF